MQSKSGETSRRTGAIVAIIAALVACGPSSEARQSSGVGDIQRLLAAENQLAFEATETTIDISAEGEKSVVTSRILVAEGLRLEKIVSTNIEPDSEGSRGSQFATGPADVETLPVPMFPSDIDDFVLLAQNYRFTRLGSDADAGWRVEPIHHSGYPIEFVLSDSGLWIKITVFDRTGNARLIRTRESVKILAQVDEDRLGELRKKGRPAVAPSSGSHVEESLSSDEARSRLEGVYLPRSPMLGFVLRRIESVVDGATGSEVILVTLGDGLTTLVLAQTRPPATSIEVHPGDSDSGSGFGTASPAGDDNGSRRIVVQKSVDRSDSGVSVYQWTTPNGITLLLISTIPAADTRRIIEEILGLETR